MWSATDGTGIALLYPLELLTTITTKQLTWHITDDAASRPHQLDEMVK
ncbi:hypothetical protein HMPREF9069_00341 [Atopobium sp. oral taxon 810 str. F0209]|nr:hypothetical protein HMPREF9069_00341 [Atopobium sp. oral taxon 810 str. F0209]